MESKFENGKLTIYLSGNVDSANAEEVSKGIFSILEKYPEKSLVLDLEDLKYISSAGLRVILKLKKQEKDLELINASSEIYEIFDMTGFTEMMHISRGYRKLSVEGCEVIGEGSNGIVYRLNPDTIIKVYKNSDAIDDIKRERELARTALVMGVNTAIPYDVVKVGDKYGSVFELLSAKSLTKLIKEDPQNREHYAEVFTDMMKEIHSTKVKEGLLPKTKDQALGWVKWLKEYLPEKTYEKLYRLVEEIPDDLHMIHGDYHANNVHYANNEAILIDMDTLSTGNPVFEFASFYLAYEGYGMIDHSKVEDFMKLDWDNCQFLLKRVPELYFAGKDQAYVESMMKKAKTIGYARMLRRTLKREKDNQALIDHSLKTLISLVDENDSLAFERD